MPQSTSLYIRGGCLALGFPGGLDGRESACNAGDLGFSGSAHGSAGSELVGVGG